MSAPTWEESKALDRLWIDDLVVGEPDECWEWLGAHDRGGYSRGSGLAHRRVAELVGKSAPQLHHACENPGCVNPNHLEPLTSQQAHTDRHYVSVCKRGHSLTDPSNVYFMPPTGYRRCRKCHAMRERERQQRLKRVVQ